MDTGKASHERIKKLVTEINALTSELSANRIVFFRPISIEVRYHNAEVCFGDLINWLYVLFVEASTPSLHFINRKLNISGVSLSSDAQNVSLLVHAIRTVTSHNMDPESESDQSKINYTEEWFQSVVAKSKPVDENEWVLCNIKLLAAVIVYVEAIAACIRILSAGEHFDIVLSEWLNLVGRDYSSYDFEQVLIEVLQNHGLDGIFDTTKIAHSEIGKWKEKLKALKDGFDFKKEAYGIIERDILKKELCPVTGQDLITIGVQPGKKMGEILAIAKRLFNENPCTKEVLLQRLAEKLLPVDDILRTL